MSVSENVRTVRARMAAAAQRAGRDVSAITLVAVTKTFPAATVDLVLDAGVPDVAENRIQEFEEKSARVRGDARWHLVGSLQRNKVARAVGRFTLIHSVDRVDLAERLDRLGGERAVITPVLLQVNTAREVSKHGFDPDDALRGLEAILGLRYLDVRGVMTMGPLSDNPDDTRRAFRDLYDLTVSWRRATGALLPVLSMGMSGDFEIAIEEGATMIRVGSAITGGR